MDFFSGKKKILGKLLIRKNRILKIEKFAVALYDLNRFFANFSQKSNYTPAKDWMRLGTCIPYI